MEAKDHYESKPHPQRKKSLINERTYKFMDRLNLIESVFEFGCNVGRHLLQFRKKGFQVYGIDVNATHVFEARFINSLTSVEVGDELSLKDIPDNSFDLVFTNSVLCHIEDISDILHHLKRISRRHLIMVEAVERQGQHWRPHDYPGKPQFTINSDQKVPYRLYYYNKINDHE